MPTGNSPTANGGGSSLDELRQWERDWRESTTAQIQQTTKNLADVAGIVREMHGDVKELKDWRAGIENRRENRIERQPDNRRANIALIVSLAMVALYLLSDLISLTFTIAQHWR